VRAWTEWKMKRRSATRTRHVAVKRPHPGVVRLEADLGCFALASINNDNVAHRTVNLLVSDLGDLERVAVEVEPEKKGTGFGERGICVSYKRHVQTHKHAHAHAHTRTHTIVERKTLCSHT
jgi:hypothetical protein